MKTLWLIKKELIRLWALKWKNALRLLSDLAKGLRHLFDLEEVKINKKKFLRNLFIYINF